MLINKQNIKSDEYLIMENKFRDDVWSFVKKLINFAFYLLISCVISIGYLYISTKIVFSEWQKSHLTPTPQNDAPDVSGFANAILDLGLISVFCLIILAIIFFLIKQVYKHNKK